MCLSWEFRWRGFVALGWYSGSVTFPVQCVTFMYTMWCFTAYTIKSPFSQLSAVWSPFIKGEMLIRVRMLCKMCWELGMPSCDASVNLQNSLPCILNMPWQWLKDITNVAFFRYRSTAARVHHVGFSLRKIAASHWRRMLYYCTSC